MSDEPKCTCHDADWIYGVDPGEGFGPYRGWWCAICHGEDMPPMIHSGDKPEPEWHCDINCPIHGNQSAGGREEMTYQDLRDELTQTCVEQERRIRELEAEVERLVELDEYNMDIYAKRTAERDALRAENNRLTHSLVEAMGERDRLRRLFERTARDVWDLEEIDNGAWQDTARDLGLIVEVPADEDFREEYGADTMYVWAWSPLAKGGTDG